MKKPDAGTVFILVFFGFYIALLVASCSPLGETMVNP